MTTTATTTITHGYKGEQLSVAQLRALPEAIAISDSALRARLRLGWDAAAAISTPIGDPRPATTTATPPARANGHAKKRMPPPAKSAPAAEPLFRVVCYAAGVEVASGELTAQAWALLVQELRAKAEG